MRIVGGSRRGLALAGVGKGDAAAHLRPTSDRVRESIFNLLINGGYGDPVTDARVLDLFAGTGALGLEALSRGAQTAVLVDDGRVAGRLIAENIAKTRFDDRARHLRADATRLRPNDGAPHDLIFLDPPYGKGMAPRALAQLAGGGWLSDDALVVCEENAPLGPVEGFEVLDSRAYGGTHVTLLRPDA